MKIKNMKIVITHLSEVTTKGIKFSYQLGVVGDDNTIVWTPIRPREAKQMITKFNLKPDKYGNFEEEQAIQRDNRMGQTE